MNRILVVDDDRNLRYSFRKILRDDEYELVEAESGEQAIEKVEHERPDLVVMDVRMPTMSGLEAFKRIKELNPGLPVIVMTAYGAVGTAIEAMKLGAYEYVLKPFDVEAIRALIKSGLEAYGLMARKVSYKPLREGEEGDRIVGSSPKMQGVYKEIGRIAASDVTVLLRGESGTGKELVARAIYQYSSRSESPFLAVNCAAIPETLLESELFGYEKGAFTGANFTKIGKLERCNHGTVFLDEIGDMTLSTQSKILRVLEEGEFERLGGTKTVGVDLRVIAATNKDLERAIRDGTFREDLYYRLKVITIRIPPLRERFGDIPELVEYFLRKYNREFKKQLRKVSDDVLRELGKRSWPGNVRELENVIKRAVVVGRGEILLPGHLLSCEEEVPSQTAVAREDWRTTLGTLVENISLEVEGVLPALEETLIRETLRKTKGNQSQAAKILGVSRYSLRGKLKKYNITTQAKVE